MIHIHDTLVTVKPDNRKDQPIDILIKISFYNLTKFVNFISLGLRIVQKHFKQIHVKCSPVTTEMLISYLGRMVP